VASGLLRAFEQELLLCVPFEQELLRAFEQIFHVVPISDTSAVHLAKPLGGGIARMCINRSCLVSGCGMLCNAAALETWACP